MMLGGGRFPAFSGVFRRFVAVCGVLNAIWTQRATGLHCVGEAVRCGARFAYCISLFRGGRRRRHANLRADYLLRVSGRRFFFFFSRRRRAVCRGADVQASTCFCMSGPRSGAPPPARRSLCGRAPPRAACAPDLHCLPAPAAKNHCRRTELRQSVFFHVRAAPRTWKNLLFHFPQTAGDKRSAADPVLDRASSQTAQYFLRFFVDSRFLCVEG